MMGADFGDADERAISRVVNAQYEQNAAASMPPLLGANATGSLMPPNAALLNGTCKLRTIKRRRPNA